MIKILSVIVLISASLFSQNFEQFLDSAIKNSPYLKASHLGIQQAKESGDILKRYQNPNLELEVSNFSSDIVGDKLGYRASYSQPIRLWGIANAKDELSLSMKKSATSLNSLNIAKFKKDISLFYTVYANQKQLLILGNEELKIAKKIFDISKQRNDAGTISRVELLQAEVAYEMVSIRIKTLKLSTQDSYYKLLRSAGINKEIDLDFKHEFNLVNKLNDKSNPDLQYIKSNQKKALAQADVNSNSIEWMSLVAEIEVEPDQDIMRVGASIPLAIFNNRSQEQRISQLDAKKSELIFDNENAKLNIMMLRLTKQRDLLLKLKSQNENTLINQIKLLKMFEEGYKIASVNLLQLQNIKNNVIQTKENIINLITALDKNTINQNYIAGAYND